jgi:hypothetical protein
VRLTRQQADTAVALEVTDVVVAKWAAMSSQMKSTTLCLHPICNHSAKKVLSAASIAMELAAQPHPTPALAMSISPSG